MPQLELFEAPIAPDALIEHELALWKSGFKKIAGVDEVGRGPLAGPVVACACILPKGVVFHGIKDSKALTARERERLSDFLTSHPDVIYALAEVAADEIDKINILQASLLAMKKAVDALSSAPDFVIVDGRDLPLTPYAAKAIIKGDAVSQTIGAASILAKVYRDKLMDNFHKKYPQYGFNKHKGYATADHREALATHGPSPIHRKSFGGVRVIDEVPTLF